MKRPSAFRLIRTGSHTARVFAAAIATAITAASAPAAALYWNGSNAGWFAVEQWSNADASPAGAFPVATDTAHFNLAGINTNTIITLDADQAATGLVFDSTGTVTLASGDPGTNKLTLGAGGMVVSSGAGAATISAPVAMSASSAFNVAAGTLLTLNGNVTGAGINLQKTGAGTLNVNGNLWSPLDTPHQHLDVNAGAMNISNSNVRATGIFTNNTSATGSNLTMTNSTVYIDGSTNDWGSLNVGHASGLGAHAFNMHGGSLSTLYGGILQGSSGGGVRSIATFDNDAAVSFAGSIWFMGDNGGQHGSQTAVIRSGTVTCDLSSNIQVGVVGGYNVFDQVGGTVNAPMANGTNGWGHSHRAGISLQFRMGKPDNFGIYNLGSAATLIAGSIISGDSTTECSQNNAYFNFHGGTLKPVANEANFIRTTVTGVKAAIAAPQAVVYSENAVIDTNGKDIAIQQPLRAPAGNGVSDTTITVSGTNQGSGYNATPIIYVTTNPALEPSAGCINGATAVANMVDDGTGKGTSKIASITVTNPGQNFSATPVLAAQGGSPVTAADLSSFTLTTAPNVSGGLTKNGLGTLTLGGVNTYTGNTIVNDGSLVLAANAGLKFAVTNASSTRITGTGTLELNGDFTLDTSAVTAGFGTWNLVDVTNLTETFGATFTVAVKDVDWFETDTGVWTKTDGLRTWTFSTSTGDLTLTTSGAVTYADWASDKGIPGAPADGDADNDSVTNAVEMVVGGDPKLVMDAKLLPELALVTNPAGVGTGNYLEFTYRRTDISVTAGVAATCETGTDLVSPWIPAVGGEDGVVVLVDNDYPPYGTATDRVRVYVPRGANANLFGRLHVTVP